MLRDVIIAALNEEEGIGLTLAETSQKISPNQVLVVDGHSDDRTVEIAKDLGDLDSTFSRYLLTG